MPDQNDCLIVGQKKFTSRLMIGTGRYRNERDMKAAIAESATQIVTVAIRRLDLKQTGDQGMLDDLIKGVKQILPNTAGCKTAQEAIFTARLARDLVKTDFIKLEVIPDAKYLLPDPVATLEAAEVLVKDGFNVLPYINADPVLAKRLEDVGCVTVMPLGSPIGSAQGVRNISALAIIIEQSAVPVVVDAGLGVPSDAALVMEMGASAVLINTAIA